MNLQDDEKKTENQPPSLDDSEEIDKDTHKGDQNAAPDPPENSDMESDANDDDDWSRRKLCSDGNCIGVIGPNGRCKECGKPYEPSGEDKFEEEEEYLEDETVEQDFEQTPELEEDQDADIHSTDDDDWTNRKLCSDGNCIGVIGPDGRCKECGKPYKG